MPAIGLSLSVRSFSRRYFLGVFAAALHGSDGESSGSTLKLLTQLASRLTDGNLPGSLEAFAKTMPGYGDVSADLGALAAQYDVICVIEIREESGDEARRTADTEWFLQLRSKEENGPTERRTTAVKIVTAKSGGKWRITSLEPRSFLAPPQVR